MEADEWLILARKKRQFLLQHLRSMNVADSKPATFGRMLTSVGHYSSIRENPATQSPTSTYTKYGQRYWRQQQKTTRHPKQENSSTRKRLFSTTTNEVRYCEVWFLTLGNYAKNSKNAEKSKSTRICIVHAYEYTILGSNHCSKRSSSVLFSARSSYIVYLHTPF